MPKTQKKFTKLTKPIKRKIVLEKRDPEIKSYPPNTWAILKPVNDPHLSYIFLTETFNCLGKFPDSAPTHHQLPLDPQINDRHCLIRIENFTDSTGVSSSNIILEDISDMGTMVNGRLVKRDNCHPSVITITNNSKIEFPASRATSGLYAYELNVINLRSNGKFDKVYKLGDILGKGHFSSVHKAKRSADGTIYAVKVLEKPTIIKEIKKQIKMIQSELQILNSLAHENLIKIFEYYDEPEKIYLVIEYVEDGEFLDFCKNRALSEEEIRIIFVQLFSAIKYLHDRKIVHRDLKPENILMPSKEGLRIKVTDFGLSKLLNIDYSTMQTKCGTVTYVAPEVLEPGNNRSYNRAVDMWSAGVILYACLCGRLPFDGEPYRVIQGIRSGVYSMNSPIWNRVSETAKHLVRALLNKDTYSRLTVEDALNHPFIKYGGYIPLQMCYNQESRRPDEKDDSSNEDFFSCISEFSRLSTVCELENQSYITVSETIRSYSSVENEISSPSEKSI